jgi:hypothetical protein
VRLLHNIASHVRLRDTSQYKVASDAYVFTLAMHSEGAEFESRLRSAILRTFVVRSSSLQPNTVDGLAYLGGPGFDYLRGCRLSLS